MDIVHDDAEAPHFLPVIFTIKPKALTAGKDITANICINRMATKLKAKVKKYAGRGKLARDVEGSVHGTILFGLAISIHYDSGVKEVTWSWPSNSGGKE
jgi:hypothetical protein